MKTGFLLNSLCHRKRRGLVLLSVLLVSLFLLAASTGFALFARRTARSFDRQQRLFTARMVCEAALPAAKELIMVHPDGAHAPGDDEFTVRTLTFPDVGVTVDMSIIPLNDGIPLNSLFLPGGETLRTELEGPWKNLWRRAGAENLEAVTLDFIDGDTDPRLGGEERDNFLNRSLLSVDELTLVPGITEDIFSGNTGKSGIRPLVTLWSDGKINGNTAPPDVLSLLDGLDERIAADLAEARRRKPFTSMEDLAAVPSFPSSARTRLMNVLAFTSSHFRVSFSVVFADGEKIPIGVILEKTSSTPKTIRWEEP